MTSSSQAITATARNSSPLARCMVPMRPGRPVASTLSSSTAERQPACFTAALARVELRRRSGRTRRSRAAARPRQPLGDPAADRLRSPPPARRRSRSSGARPVEHGDRAAPALARCRRRRPPRRQQPVGLRSDLVRGAVVDAQRRRAPADVDAERLPRERLLEDPLAEVAGEEQGVRPAAAERGQEAQLATPRSCASSTTAKSNGAAAGLLRSSATRAEQLGPGRPTLRFASPRARARRSPTAPRAACRRAASCGRAGRRPGTLPRSSCQASTTSAHSPQQEPRLNRWPSTAPPACPDRPLGSAPAVRDWADRKPRRYTAHSRSGRRPRVDSTRHCQLVADQIAEFHLQHVRQRFREDGERRQSPQLALGQERARCSASTSLPIPSEPAPSGCSPPSDPLESGALVPGWPLGLRRALGRAVCRRQAFCG